MASYRATGTFGFSLCRLSKASTWHRRSILNANARTRLYNVGQPTACDSDGLWDILFESQTPHQTGEIFYFWMVIKIKFFDDFLRKYLVYKNQHYLHYI